jgi:hypothetical protein
MSEKSSFVSELKRRHVVRMAGLYLVGAWLLTQVATSRHSSERTARSE